MKLAKLDAVMMATALLAVGVLAAAWLVNALRPHPSAAATKTTVITMHAAAPAVPSAVSPPPSAAAPSYKDAKSSFRIFEATYGVRQHGREWHARVDDRAYNLLLHKGWLRVSPKFLGADPRPYHPKLLYLNYEVLGKEVVMVRREGQGLTLHQLIMHAKVLPPKTADPDPAATKAASEETEITVQTSDDDPPDPQTVAAH